MDCSQYSISTRRRHSELRASKSMVRSHFEGEFLLEAKWKGEKTPPADLDSFAAKVGRKLDNTLGLFLSMNGFQDSAVEMHSRRRAVVILMDGGDLSAVVDGRISLPDLLRRKRQHAARTGDVYISAYTLIG